MMRYKILESLQEEEKCLECGQVYYGRTNQKFCCESCKNRFNNRKSQALRNTKLRIMTIIDRNYSILSKLVKEQRYSMSLFDLCTMGYNIDYMTSYCKISRHEHCGCYDISFIKTPARIYNIRRVEYEKQVELLHHKISIE